MTEDKILSDLGSVIARGATDRPVIVISYAQSLDGCLTRRQGTPYPLSGDAAMRVTHGIRSQCDGLLAGIGTVLADDPRLTTRMGFSGDPLPIILDSRLRFPTTARLLGNKTKPLIATLAGCESTSEAALRGAGAAVWSFPPDDQGRIPLPLLLSTLYKDRQVRAIMVEGGAKVIAAFLDAGLCDYLIVTVAPVFLANRNAVSLALSGSAAMPSLPDLNHAKLGKDLIVWGAPQFL